MQFKHSVVVLAVYVLVGESFLGTRRFWAQETGIDRKPVSISGGRI